MLIDTDKVVDDTYYDPETGRLFRVKELVTTTDDGYRVRSRNIAFQGMRRQATHVMFYIMMGRWPEPGMVIDHKDCKQWNTKWNNLREATQQQNIFNRYITGRHLTEQERQALYGEFAYKGEKDVV